MSRWFAGAGVPNRGLLGRFLSRTIFALLVLAGSFFFAAQGTAQAGGTISSTTTSAPVGSTLNIGIDLGVSFDFAEFDVYLDGDWWNTNGITPEVPMWEYYVQPGSHTIQLRFIDRIFDFSYLGESNILTITGLQTQSITFPTLGAGTVGGNASLTATATSGLTVTFSSRTQSVCTVSGSTVSYIAAGTCTVAADQSGNSSYAPAAQVTQDITVNSG